MYKNLTPKRAWEIYVQSEEYIPRSVEFFLSNFREDGYTNITRMCKVYAHEIIEASGELATSEYIAEVAVLLEEYILQYIEQIGGKDKLNLYSTEELEVIYKQQDKEILAALRRYQESLRSVYGLTGKE